MSYYGIFRTYAPHVKSSLCLDSFKLHLARKKMTVQYFIAPIIILLEDNTTPVGAYILIEH